MDNKKLEKFFEEFFAKGEDVKIRSQVIPITGKTFSFDMATIEPYSFRIVNTGTADMLSTDGSVLAKGANANSMDTSLFFPVIRTFRRNDIIKLKSSSAVTDMEGFILADLELPE